MPENKKYTNTHTHTYIYTHIYIHIHIYIYIIYVYIFFHPKEAKCTFFLNIHGTFSKVDQMIVHKTSINKFKKIEIISSIFFDHKGLKLETNPKGKTQNTQNHGD